MTVCQKFFKLKFSKVIQNFRTLNVFGKFLLIVYVLADTLTLFQSSGVYYAHFVCPGMFRELPERLKKQQSLHCSAVWCSGMVVVVIFASRIRRGRVTDEGELIAVPG